VLQARGFESESELSFAGLADLLRPLVGRLGDLPEPQGLALASALRLGPPVGGDRFAVYAGALGLLVAAAETRPVLAVVDDVHWLDPPSREALLFVARRVREEPVVLLLATRAGEAPDLEAAGLPTLVLAGLESAAALALLERHAGDALSPSVAERLVALTGGNPLALIEAPSLLDEGQLSGEVPLEDPLPVGPALERAFRLRLDALPGQARRALVVAAAGESGDVSELSSALGLLGLDSGSLGSAEERGLVSLEGQGLRFRHPLLRSAVYYGATPGERRAAHRALADALAAEHAAAERRAWHLAAAAAGPEEAPARALEEAGRDARQRGGYAAAAAAFAKAASLTPEPADRAARLRLAGESAFRGGQTDEAVALLEGALTHAGDVSLRCEIQFLRGQIEYLRDARKAYSLLVEEASRLEARGSRPAALLLATAALAACRAGEHVAAREAAERAKRLVGPASGDLDPTLALALGGALVHVGHLQEGVPLLLREVPSTPDGEAAGLLLDWLRIDALLQVGEVARARELAERRVEAARSASALALLADAALQLARAEMVGGRWRSAAASFDETQRLAIETALPRLAVVSLCDSAVIAAHQGAVSRCLALAREVAEVTEHYGGPAELVDEPLGQLAFVSGRFDEAIQRLEGWCRVGMPVIPDLGDVIEAYARLGRRREAQEKLADLSERAEASSFPWARALVCRCRGLLADESALDEHFLQASEWHALANQPFALARTRLCYGERLRHARRRREARDQLRPALEIFEQLDARPWAERAAAELRATGERAQESSPPVLRPLTSQEARVAIAVAQGATNLEAARTLFISPKTVEFHLANVYRKLSLRSRTELARLIADDEPVRTGM